MKYQIYVNIRVVIDW